ncbi:MAG: uracil phosphoribosyltransferase [Bdellovibrionaceae bacterium]|nr:uracil phosphoribosyltransferase [Bdellovibrionales bacterium]MCB9083788.1 uracil phosphoribosyltransferase [Pseudobdellovibrionaceae bacterium]
MELKHHYGKQIHILDSDYLTTLLWRLCSPETHQPLVNQLVEVLYSGIVKRVMDKEFPQMAIEAPTRMTALHPGKVYTGSVLDQNQSAVVVNLARAGTLPSYVCYQTLNFLLNPQGVRQDHIMAARKTDASGAVIGTDFGASKIGGPVDKSVVLFPDPMGATGGTIVSALDYYKSTVEGKAAKYVALHLIVTPEYLKRVTESHPDLIVYAIRLDRGLSSDEVLRTELGARWDEERGLDDHHYIVPGGGGLGEIMNNSFV